jgi:hypothetical protein
MKRHLAEKKFSFESPTMTSYLWSRWHILYNSHRFRVIRRKSIRWWLQRRPFLAEKIVLLIQFESPPGGVNNFVRKPVPDFLLVFCWHFVCISNHFRVIHIFYSLFTESRDLAVRWRRRPEMTLPIDLSTAGFLLVFNTCFLSTVYRSLVIGVFWEVINGRLSISAARGRRKPKLKSSFYSSTTVSY